MAKKNLTVRQGRCINFRNCSKADAKEVQEVNLGDDFICSNCGSDLQEIPIPPGVPWGLITVIVAVVTVLGFGAYMLFFWPPPPPPVLSINPKEANVLAGETVKLTATIEPEDKKVKWNWTSGDEGVATVNDRGVVTGVSEGSVTITVTDEKSKVSESVSVIVVPPPPSMVTVTFNSNGGSEVSVQTVRGGEKATKPSNPTKHGNTFGGWFTDNNTFADEWIFASEVVTNVTLYAKWNGDTPPPCGNTTITYSFGRYVGVTIRANGKCIPEASNGTMYYTCRVQIAKHGSTTYYAEKGDTFVGTWANGDIVNGRLLDSNNNQKASILAGKRPNPYDLSNDRCE